MKGTNTNQTYGMTFDFNSMHAMGHTEYQWVTCSIKHLLLTWFTKTISKWYESSTGKLFYVISPSARCLIHGRQSSHPRVFWPKVMSPETWVVSPEILVISPKKKSSRLKKQILKRSDLHSKWALKGRNLYH